MIERPSSALICEEGVHSNCFGARDPGREESKLHWRSSYVLLRRCCSYVHRIVPRRCSIYSVLRSNVARPVYLNSPYVTGHLSVNRLQDNVLHSIPTRQWQGRHQGDFIAFPYLSTQSPSPSGSTLIPYFNVSRPPWFAVALSVLILVYWPCSIIGTTESTRLPLFSFPRTANHLTVLFYFYINAYRFYRCYMDVWRIPLTCLAGLIFQHCRYCPKFISVSTIDDNEKFVCRHTCEILV